MIFTGDKATAVYEGYYRPAQIYNGSEKIAGYETIGNGGADQFLLYDSFPYPNTYNDYFTGFIYGRSLQEDTPTPLAPSEILNSGGGYFQARDITDTTVSQIRVPLLQSVKAAAATTAHTYTDGNGNKQHADSLEYKGNGQWEYIKRIGTRALTGNIATEGWVRRSGYESTFYAPLSGTVGALNGPYRQGTGYLGGLCSDYVYQNEALDVNGKFWLNNSSFGSYGYYLLIADTRFTGAEALTDFAAYLAARYAAGDPVIVQYIYAAPVTITLTNLITNGNFVNTTGWTGQNANLSVSPANTLNIEGAGAAAYSNAYQTLAGFTGATGKIVYAQFEFMVTNSNCVSVVCANYNGTITEIAYTRSTPSINTWYKASFNFTMGASWEGKTLRQYFRHTYANTANATGAIMQMQNAMTIDSTACFGAGNEPTAADMGEYAFPWFNGSRATLGIGVLPSLPKHTILAQEMDTRAYSNLSVKERITG